MIKKHILCVSVPSAETVEESFILAQLKQDTRFELRPYALKTLAAPNSSEESYEIKDQQIENIIRQSYLSEAILLPKQLYFKNIYPELASRIHCPLILYGNEDVKISHVLFVVGSNPDSVVGIKQFCHLFPSLCQHSKMTLLIYGDGSGMEKLDEQMVVSYLKKWNKTLAVFKVHVDQMNNVAKHIEAISSRSPCLRHI